jgi:hypothetical protein
MSQTKVKSGLLNFPDQTDFVKLPSGTTAQRPSSPEKGYSRYNTTDNKLEYWNGTIWQQLPGVVAPTIESVSYPGDDLAADPAGGQTITLTGTNFLDGATVEIEGTLAPVVTVVSKTEITFTAPAKAAGDYDILLTNGDNTTATFIDGITYNGLPSWTTPAGNLGSFPAGSTIPTITLVATEPDSGVVSYSVTTGALPTGLTLTGADIDGTVPSPAGQTTYNFSVTASDDENQESTERSFNIVVYIQVKNTLNESDPFGDSSGMAFYKLNNNYTEETGNYSAGVFAGTGSTSFSDGIFNESLYFTGTGSRRMKMPGISNSIMGSSYSFSCWVNYVSVGSNSSYFQTATGSGTYTSGDYNQFNFYFQSGNIRSSAKRGLYTDSNEVINSGDIESIVGTGWRFITATLDASTGDITSYLDGREVWKKKGFFVGGLTTSGPNDEEVYIGNHPNNWYNDIKYDQIRWFNRALTPLEVESLYRERTVVCGGQADTLDILGDNSCIAAYQLNGNANDLSGNYSGTATDVSYGVGEFDLAGVFNGTSSYIDTNYLVAATDVNSFSFWVKTTSTGTEMLFSKINGGNQNGNYYLLISDGTLILRAWGGSGDQVSYDGNYNDGNWHHVTAIFNYPNKKLYVDGQLRGETNSVTGTFASTGNINIGYWVQDGDLFFNGSIDQFRIFNKALSAGEVTTLYNETACDALSCSGGTTNTLDILSDGSCVAAYPLDGSPADLSGNYNGVQTDVTYPVGKFDLAAAYNGVSSKIYGVYEMDFGNTISMWINVDGVTSADSLGLWTQVGSDSANGYAGIRMIRNSDTNYKVQGFIRKDNDYIYRRNDSVTINSGWNHFVFIINNSTGYDFYVNGVNGNFTNWFVAGNWQGVDWQSLQASIGYYSTSSPFEGKIDQVRIFNKALTLSEIGILYNNETACH